MPLSPSARLGPYQIHAPLGAGGMGEVYRATDTRLDRTVAIKVLPEHLAANTEFRQRLEREARAAAALNHPHICALYDIGRQDGIDFLVMEFLEGETLAARLRQGRLSLDQALRFAIEIAGALAYAHRHEVFHRDLKPGNVMLTRAGSKLLDFGLAKIGPAAPAPAEGAAAAPTISADLTQKGSLLGTLQYMAPEQLEGKPAGARSDLFAFGAVLYEMVTGRKAFEGSSQASLIGAILHSEPPSMIALDPVTPPALDRLVKKCLAKDPDQRWHSARDLETQLQWLTEAAPTTPSPIPHPPSPRLSWLAAAVCLVAAAVLGVLYFRRVPVDQPPVRFSLAPPEKSVYRSFVVPSPDGRRLAFLADTAGKSRLWVRSLDSLAAEPVPDSDYGQPFWSPDSRYLAYFGPGKLNKVAVGGPSGLGTPEIICPCDGVSGAWSRSGVIVFTTWWGQGLSRVPAAGGRPEPLTTLDKSRLEHTHLWPRFLPDGRHILFLAASRQYQNNQIYAVSLDSKKSTPVLSADSFAGYVQPSGDQAGRLLFVRRRALLAQPFDDKALRLTGEPVTVVEKTQYIAPDALAVAAVSDAGVLVYQDATARRIQFAWFDAAGKRLAALGAPDDYGSFRLSPDASRLAVTRLDQESNQHDIWSVELARGIASRLTFEPSSEFHPVWSPDGRLAYYSDRDGVFDLFFRPLGARKDEDLLRSGRDKCPTAWSGDGRFLVFHHRNIGDKSDYDLWAIAMAGDRKPVALLQTESNEMWGAFSPDGRWLAYVSDESGKNEVYVQRFGPGAALSGERLQISHQGGSWPRWRRDGKELFFVAPDQKLVAVDVRASASALDAGKPRPLFELPPALWSRDDYPYDVDGQRFLLPTLAGDPTPLPLTIVLNWKPGKD